MEQGYTENNCTRNLGKPYLFSNPDKLNILADATENKLGLRYTTHLINCHLHQKGFNAVFKSTVNIPFFRIQPKRTRVHKTQQVSKNEVKWKELIQSQTKKRLIMLNRISEDKE